MARQSARRKGLTEASRLVGRRVRELRGPKGKDWSQERFAAALSEFGIDMHVSAVAKIEHGDRSVTVDELLLFALVLDVSPAVLLDSGAADEDVTIAPGRQIDRSTALRWVRGLAPLSGQEFRFFDAHHAAVRSQDAFFDAWARANKAHSALERAQYVGDSAAVARARKTLLPHLSELKSKMDEMRSHGLDVEPLDEELLSEMRSAGMEV